jgi:ribosome-binding protein aMBF1 (putative translation factor)
MKQKPQTAIELANTFRKEGRNSLLTCVVSVIDQQDGVIELLQREVEYLNTQLTASRMCEPYPCEQEAAEKYEAQMTAPLPPYILDILEQRMSEGSLPVRHVSVETENASFGSVVKRMRKRRGMKRAELADKIGTVSREIRKVEAGNIWLSPEEKKDFCAALQMTVTVDGETYTYDKTAQIDGVPGDASLRLLPHGHALWKPTPLNPNVKARFDMGQCIHDLRKEQVVGRKELAAHANITVEEMEQIEMGDVMCSVIPHIPTDSPVLSRIASYLGVGIANLWVPPVETEIISVDLSSPLPRCSPDAVDFGRRVRKARKAASMTRLDLGMNVGYSKEDVTDLEKGEMFVSPDTARLFAKILCVDIADLWPL